MKRVRRNSLVVPGVLESVFFGATDGDDEARGTSARVLDAVVSEVMPQPYLFFDFKLLVGDVHARPEQAVSRVNLRALIHSVGFVSGK